MTSLVTHSKALIEVRKIYHRDAWHIGFYFDYSQKIYSRLKKIPSARYSQTHRCIYIPYTNAAFEEFKLLGLAYFIVEQVDQKSRTRHTPDSSVISATHPSGPMKEGRKLDTDIQSAYGLKHITWQDNHFFIDIVYSSPESTFLKGLYGSYWNAKQKLWVCKGTLQNCETLQDRYSYWDEESLSKIRQHASAYSKQAKIIIKAIPGDLSKLEVNVRFASKAIGWLKAITHRRYDAASKRWIIPRDKKIVDRFVSQCRTEGYVVHEMLSWTVETPFANARNRHNWLKAILKGVPAEQLELMQAYGTVFIRENYSYETMKAYCSSFRRYMYSLEDLERINDRTRADIEEYLNEIANQRVSYQELNRHISAIKFYYEKLGGWTRMRLTQILRPKRAKNLPYIFSVGEVKRLLSVISHPKHKCMLFLAYGCGLRAGEVVSLQIRDIMLDRNQIFIRGSKGKKDRVVMVPKSIIPILQLYMQRDRPDHWLFPGQNRSRPYSRSSLRSVFKKALEKSGLDPRHKLHNLRHSFATHLMESGTQQRLIQKLLGHSSSKTTEIYTHISRGSVTQVESPLDKLGDDFGKDDINEKNVKK